MTATARKDAAFEVRAVGPSDHRYITSPFLSLRATEDGWSLMAEDGVVVFRGFGLASRRQCLRYAHDLGALAVLG